MLEFMRSGAFRSRGTRGHRLFVAACLCFLVAILFTTGLEAFGHHSHEGPAPDQNCVACRHLETPASSAPTPAGIGTALLPDPRSEPPVVPLDIPETYTPAPSFLRGPPIA